MNGKRVLITGGTNGIGKVAALELAKMGAEVIIVGRNPQKTERVLNEVKIESGSQKLDMLIADLSSMAQIRTLATEFLSKYDSLDVLLNNAGGFFNSYQQSVDGIEMTFALNHFSYFLLTNLLLDTIRKTAHDKGEARIINTSSGSHLQVRGGLTWDNFDDESAFSVIYTYGESKLANVLFTYELARRLDGTGVTVNTFHPGFTDTGIGSNTTGIMASIVKLVQRLVARSPEKGAETMIYLASSPAVNGVTGQYWYNKKAIKSSKTSHDVEQQKRLWDVSAEITGIAE